MLWVAYDEEGLPLGVFDSALELAEFIGVSRFKIYWMIEHEDPRIARIREEDEEDDKDIT